MSQITPYVQFDFQGGQELADELSELDRKIQRQYCRVALKDGSKPILSAIKSSNAYIDQTGLLRESAKAAIGRGDKPGNTSVLIGFNTTVGGYLEKGTSSANQRADLQEKLISKYLGNAGAKYRTYYARMVEFGHEPGGWYAKMSSAKYVPAHSFARTSFDATVDAAADIVEESLADQIESAQEN